MIFTEPPTPRPQTRAPTDHPPIALYFLLLRRFALCAICRLFCRRALGGRSCCDATPLISQTEIFQLAIAPRAVKATLRARSTRP